jgi:hypothetical protein
MVNSNDVADVEFREVRDRPNPLTSAHKSLSLPDRSGRLTTDAYDRLGRPNRYVPPPGSAVDVLV